jgi:light-regulated signal transduction histidine kinase (bacteriophytochrome)
VLKRRYQGQLDERADELITHTIDGATRMGTLISDLLEYSRVGTRGQALRPTDCNAALRKALTNLEVALRESNAVVTRDELPVAEADETQLTQLFQNLIGNAVKFKGAAPPRVHVGVRQADGYWNFSVADNGIGFAPEYAERVFAIFQRLHTRSEYPGTGVGLAICKKIVDRHGGRIWVETEPGKGSTFHFTIPEGAVPPNETP